MAFQRVQFQKISGAECPRTPLKIRASGALKLASVTFKFYRKPCWLTGKNWPATRLRRESHACESKTLISRPITPAGQFLTPDSKG